jgi:hypothetical protein
MFAHPNDGCLLYDVCLSVLCLPTCLLSAVLYDLLIFLTSSCLYDICLPVLCLATCYVRPSVPACIMSCFLWYVYSIVWCLSTFMMSAYLYVYMSYVYLSVFFLPNNIMSSYLYGVYSTVRCHHTFSIISSFLSYVCSTVWCLPTYMYDGSSTVWYLFNSKMSIY